MSLLSFDLIKMEEKLKREVKDFFHWDTFETFEEKADMRMWWKMMGHGKTKKTASTRKTLDSKRLYEKYLNLGGSDGLGKGKKSVMGGTSFTGVRL